jgi:hypothetical protein
VRVLLSLSVVVVVVVIKVECCELPTRNLDLIDVDRWRLEGLGLVVEVVAIGGR